MISSRDSSVSISFISEAFSNTARLKWSSYFFLIKNIESHLVLLFLLFLLGFKLTSISSESECTNWCPPPEISFLTVRVILNFDFVSDKISRFLLKFFMSMIHFVTKAKKNMDKAVQRKIKFTLDQCYQQFAWLRNWEIALLILWLVFLVSHVDW